MSILKRQFLILLLTFYALTCFTQEKIDEEKYQHLIDENDQPIHLIKNNAASSIVMVDVNNFTLPKDTNLAVINGGNRIEAYDSRVKFEGKTYKGFTLPETYLGRVVDSRKPIAFQVFFTIVEKLRYNKDLKKFTGRLGFILLDDSDENPASHNLKEPVRLELFSSTNLDIEPKQVFVDHTNMPSTEIGLEDISDVKNHSITIRTPFNPSVGYDTIITKVSSIVFETNIASIQGYGFQMIPLQLSIHGYEMEDSVRVSLVASRGIIKPLDLTILPGSQGISHLRSQKTGTATIKAFANDFFPDQILIEYIFPLAVLLSSLIGGTLGGFIKYLRREKKTLKFLFIDIIVGICIGFIVIILQYIAGVKIFSFSISPTLNLATLLTISFIAAFFYEEIIEFLKSLIPKPIPPTPPDNGR
jgi:hypothetical protein